MWEYRVIETESSIIEAVLNEYGADDWELVQILFGVTRPAIIYVFKRPKE